VSPVFAPDQRPTEVFAAIGAAGATWEELEEADRRLGVSKLRLAGVYDDRQEGRFMLRTRIPGGIASSEQLEAIGGVVREFAGKPAGEEGPDRFAEITTRQDLQIHWIRFEALPEIWRRYEAVGLTSSQACGDTLRNVTSCPVDGASPDAVLETGPIVERLRAFAFEDERLTAFLPRKFKVAVTGCPTDCVVARVNDLAFTPAGRGEVVGFNVHAGGGLSDSPRLASPIDLFAEGEHVVDVVRAALELYRDRGDFENKAVNRFRMLVHDLGVDQITREIRDRLPFEAPPAGEDLSTWRAEDHVGVRPGLDGASNVGVCVPLGRLNADEIAEVAELARLYGDGRVRLTQRQNLVLTGVRRTEALLAEPLLERFSPAPDPIERAVVACTSAPFCKFAILDVKSYGGDLIEALRGRVPADRAGDLRIHLSGCKASCAQVQAAHIGLRATMGRDGESYEDAFDVALGGDLSAGRLGRWARLEVPAERAFDAIAGTLAAVGTGELLLDDVAPETSGDRFGGGP
jgi:ferredoxin-nitrite reductase